MTLAQNSEQGFAQLENALDTLEAWPNQANFIECSNAFRDLLAVLVQDLGAHRPTSIENSKRLQLLSSRILNAARPFFRQGQLTDFEQRATIIPFLETDIDAFNAELKRLEKSRDK